MPPFGMILFALDLVSSWFCSWALLPKFVILLGGALFTNKPLYIFIIKRCGTTHVTFFPVETDDYHNDPSFRAQRPRWPYFRLGIASDTIYNDSRLLLIWNYLLWVLCPYGFSLGLNHKIPHNIRRWFSLLMNYHIYLSQRMCDCTVYHFLCKDWWLSHHPHFKTQLPLWYSSPTSSWNLTSCPILNINADLCLETHYIMLFNLIIHRLNYTIWPTIEVFYCIKYHSLYYINFLFRMKLYNVKMLSNIELF